MQPSKNSKFKLVVFLLGVILALLLGISFFLSSQISITKSVVIHATDQELYEQIINLKNWQIWSVWKPTYYQNKKIDYYLNQRGETWKQVIYENELKQAKGHFEITMEVRSLKPNRKIEINYLLYGFEPSAKSLFSIQPLGTSGSKTRVSWTYQGSYAEMIGVNPLRKYFLLFTRSSLDQAHHKSLIGLKNYLEKNRSGVSGFLKKIN